MKKKNAAPKRESIYFFIASAIFFIISNVSSAFKTGRTLNLTKRMEYRRSWRHRRKNGGVQNVAGQYSAIMACASTAI